jgi:hypothetical protein
VDQSTPQVQEWALLVSTHPRATPSELVKQS